MKETEYLTEAVHPFPNDKITDLSKFKESAANKLNMTQKLKFVFRRVEYIVGKEKMLIINIFSLNAMFSKGCFPGTVKTLDCLVKWYRV